MRLLRAGTAIPLGLQGIAPRSGPRSLPRVSNGCVFHTLLYQQAFRFILLTVPTNLLGGKTAAKRWQGSVAWNSDRVLVFQLTVNACRTINLPLSHSRVTCRELALSCSAAESQLHPSILQGPVPTTTPLVTPPLNSQMGRGRLGRGCLSGSQGIFLPPHLNPVLIPVCLYPGEQAPSTEHLHNLPCG